MSVRRFPIVAPRASVALLVCVLGCPTKSAVDESPKPAAATPEPAPPADAPAVTPTPEALAQADDPQTPAPSKAATSAPTAAPKLCGARAGDTCSDKEYCAYDVGQQCGWADAVATCKPRPEVCTRDYRPVCGCDGKTYPNACSAAARGTGVMSKGACKPGTGDVCGGPERKQCPDKTMRCIDDPNDTCVPDKGGKDCMGICQKA